MKGKRKGGWETIFSVILIVSMAVICYAAYHHGGDTDTGIFVSVYPATTGTKLDSCAVCHTGGTVGKNVYGSCQWCHEKTKYGAEATPENLRATLNPYGVAYMDYEGGGRTAAALREIGRLDSDGDGYTNEAEIIALTFPGDPADDPSKVPAPSRVLSLGQLEKMPRHAQFLLMNASKSDDSYTMYEGVALDNLVSAMMLDSATGIVVYSPDGFATSHPFNPSTNPNVYHVFGSYAPYPPGVFYYDRRADTAVYPPDPPDYLTGGWCNYSSPWAAGRENGSAISNPEGLKLMLAYRRDGSYLVPGILNLQNKLDGEGPYRVVPPQKTPGWPDQRSSSKNQDVLWPYVSGNDHNAGFSSRTVTMAKVEPLPGGTTDINTLEAGWPYVDGQKLVIYGAIDPKPLNNLNTTLDALILSIKSLNDTAFRVKSSRTALINKVQAIKKQVALGEYGEALEKAKEDILKKTDGCLSGAVDENDWVKDMNAQRDLCALLQKIWIMLVLMGA